MAGSEADGDRPGSGSLRLLGDLLSRLDLLVQDCKAAAHLQHYGDRLLYHGPEGWSAEAADHLQAAAKDIRRSVGQVKRAISHLERARRTTRIGGSGSISLGVSSDESADEVDGVDEERPGELTTRERTNKWRTTYRSETKKSEKEVWERFDETHNLDFFRDLLIARDGGFSEVGQLWYPCRWFSAVCMLLLTFSNVVVIIAWDLRIIMQSSTHDQPFLFNQPVLNGILKLLGVRGKFPLNGSGTICAIELAVLAMLLGTGLLDALRMVMARHECTKWTAVESFFWKFIPELSTYSAMRLLHFASPAVIFADVCKFYYYSVSRWKGRYCLVAWKWSKLLVLRCLCIVIGMDAYIVKVHAAEGSFHSASEKVTAWKLFKVLIFVMQVVGIVQLDLFVRSRLFTFIFGGEDGILQSHEKTLKAVWNGMLVRAIWREYNCLRFVALMLSFSDVDFQKLVLNERGGTPNRQVADGDPSDDSGSNSETGGEDTGESDACADFPMSSSRAYNVGITGICCMSRGKF